MVSPLQVLAARAPENPLAGFGKELQGLRMGNQNIAQAQQNQAIQAQGAQQQATQFDQGQAMQKAQFLNRLAKQLKSTDQRQWASILQPNIPAISQIYGQPAEAVIEQVGQLTPETVDSIIAQTDAVLGGQGQDVKVGARKIYSDGTIIQSTPQGPRVFSPSGQLLTGQEAQEQVSKANENEISLAGRKAGAAKTAQIESTERQNIIQQGITAIDMLKDTNKLIELNDAITTGKTAKARKFFGDLFGVTDPDLGQFNSLAGKLVLGQIRQLGANPTEGERQFLVELQPSIEQGSAVNSALLSDLKEMQSRQVERAKWFAKPENRGRTIAEYFLEADKSDFSPTYNVQEASGPQDGSMADDEYERRKNALLGG